MSYSRNTPSNSGQVNRQQLCLPMSLPEAITAHPTASGELRLSLYVDFVKSCYRNHPEAFTYYEQLIDYLEPDGKETVCS